MLDIEKILNKEEFIKTLVELGATDKETQESEWKKVKDLFCLALTGELYKALPENYRSSMPNMAKMDTDQKVIDFVQQLLSYLSKVKDEIDINNILKKTVDYTYEMYKLHLEGK